MPVGHHSTAPVGGDLQRVVGGATTDADDWLGATVYDSEYIGQVQLASNEASAEGPRPYGADALHSTVPEYRISLQQVIQNDQRPWLKLSRPESREHALPALAFRGNRWGNQVQSWMGGGRARTAEPAENAVGWGIPHPVRRKPLSVAPQTMATHLDVMDHRRTQYALDQSLVELQHLHKEVLQLPRWSERDRAQKAYKSRRHRIATAAIPFCDATHSGAQRSTPFGADVTGRWGPNRLRDASRPVPRAVHSLGARPVPLGHVQAGRQLMKRVSWLKPSKDCVTCPLCSRHGTNKWLVTHKMVSESRCSCFDLAYT